MLDTILTVGRYAGLINIIFMPAVFFIFWRKNKLKLRKHTLSDCGKSTLAGELFNLSVAIVGIFQILFTFAILNHFNFLNQYLVSVPPIIAGIFMILTGIISYRRNPKVHSILAFLLFVILIFWAVIFSIYILQISQEIGQISLIISAILLIGTSGLYFKYGQCSIPEIFFLAIAVIWNTLFSIVII